jgi:hypothetical protein
LPHRLAPPRNDVLARRVSGASNPVFAACQLSFQRYARAVIMGVGVMVVGWHGMAPEKAFSSHFPVLDGAPRAIDMRPADFAKAGSLPVFLSVCPCSWIDDADPALQ